MNLKIDDDFIREWHPKYLEGDEGNYKELVAEVALQIKSSGTISKDTFLAIWNWKGAMRVIGYVVLDQYDNLYAAAFRRAVLEPPERKLQALLGPPVKLPGFGAPTASTIIHFIHPESMPIIDVRTVEALFSARLLSSKGRDKKHYEEYRNAIDEIRRRCPDWTLRQIDRALFAYHKQILDTGGVGKKCYPT